ncbi:sensor domain-containing diguanylate cyclase [Deinococcus kurensis]|uniref:sensor domain-containing diguanylate cyclase n=1 Tax=Deinococcus kurensis TaxID=2662757 RepID=UPI0012D35538|nr:sensor domain-containing diguanylate cyclase [Deinococcus kurensis]
MSQPHCVPELMTDCYAAVDAGGTLLFVNAAAQRWLDPEATGQPLTGRPLREVLPPHCQLTAQLQASAAPGDRTCGACGRVRLHVTPTGLELRGAARAPTPRRALAEALNGARTADEVAQVILSFPDWPAPQVTLALLDPVRASLRLLRLRGGAPRLVATLPDTTLRALLGHFGTGEPTVWSARDWPAGAGTLSPGTRDLLVLPLHAPQAPLLGAVLLETGGAAGDLRHARDLAGICSAALARALHFDEIDRVGQRYRTLLESTHAALWELDHAFTIQGHSPNWEALTGQRFDEYVGRGYLDVVHPEDRPALTAAIERGVLTHAPFELRGRLRRADGLYRHVVALALPVPEARGTGQGWAGSIQDVTEEVWAAEWEVRAQQLLSLSVQGSSARLTFRAALDELTRLAPAPAALLVQPAGPREAWRTLAAHGPAARLQAYLTHLPAAAPTAEGAAPHWWQGPTQEAPLQADDLLLVPLWHEEQPIALALLDLPDGPVDPTSLAHLRWLQGHLAPVVHSALLRDALERSEAHARSIVSALDEGVVMIDTRGQIVTVNRAAGELLNLRGQPSPGLHDAGWALEDEHGRPVPLDQYPAAVALRTGQPVRQQLLARRNARGGRSWFSINAMPLDDHSGVVVSFSDVTEAVTLRQQLTAQTLQDDLTGLGNRRSFRQATQALHGPHAAALLIDVDHFKSVNDTYGHHVGDDLLRCIAARLRDVSPAGAHLARLGGDEFGLTHPTLPVGAAAALARRIVNTLGQPFTLGDARIVVSASVGVATATCVAVAELHRAADLAMYTVKRAGRSGWHLFDDTLT